MNMRDDLKAFIDNELSEEERTRILKEVDDNPELQAELIELRQISRVIHEEAWQPEPVGLEKTLRALEGKTKKRPWWMGQSFTWAVGAACTVMFAAILFPTFSQAKQAAKAGSARAAFATAGESASPLEEEAGTEASKSDTTLLKPQAGRGYEFQAEVPAAAPNVSQDYADLNDRQPVDSAKQESLAFRREMDKLPGAAGKVPASAGSTFASPRFQIKTANLSVEVEDVPKAQQETESVAKALNGRVESSQKSNDEGVLASAELTLRVPVANFETAVNRIRKLGRVLNDGLSGQDVTTQIVDTEARLKVIRAEEDQYVELLKATKKIGEVLSVKERLSQVRQEIESLDAQRKALRNQAAESTINVSLSERPKPDRPRKDDNWSEDSWSRAVSGLNSVGRAIGTGVVFLFVFSPIWMPIVLVFWWLARRAQR
jgi:anti-sigma factor RsiW